jgi:hypothetical protein
MTHLIAALQAAHLPHQAQAALAAHHLTQAHLAQATLIQAKNTTWNVPT